MNLNLTVVSIWIVIFILIKNNEKNIAHSKHIYNINIEFCLLYGQGH